jgi:hypothetical protein
MNSVVRRHLLHQLEHLTGAQPLQQRLLHAGLEVFVNLNRFVFGQQAKGQGLQSAGQPADRLGDIHLLHGLQEQLHAVVIAGLQQALELLGEQLSKSGPVGS